MKTKLNKIVAAILALLMCSLIITACNDGSEADDHLKLTQQMIESRLSGGNGTLTINDGSAEDVTSFSYTFESRYASSLREKETVRYAVDKLRSGSSLTWFETSMSVAFTETMLVVGLIYDDTESFDADTYIEEILSVLCDGSRGFYNGWSIYATINEAQNTVTINCYT